MRKCFEMGKAKWTGLVWLGGAVALLWPKKLNHMLSVLEILIKKITIFSLPLLGIEPRDSA